MNSVLQILKDNLNQTKYGLDRNIKVPYDLGMIKMIDSTIEQIESLLPIEQSQTEALKKEIEELKEKTEWISVKERLPKEFTSVLVIGNDIRSCALYRDKKFYTDFPLPTNEEITHWMPLPTPPKQ